MDFKDQIKQLSDRVARLKDSILTEEATKTALIMPFLATLGYDVFDPHEVHPEFISDIGTKKGEKVDYAIMKEGKPVILIECKHWAQALTLHDNQLLRYFHVTAAKFGLLTNGIVYRFYTDLEEPNKMDQKPFLEVNMLDLKEAHVEELKKFHKSYFDVEAIQSTASDLKYTSALKAAIRKEFDSPSEVFVKHLAKPIYTNGIMTPRLLEYFTALVKKAIHQTISDDFTDKIKTALNVEEREQAAVEPVVLEEKREGPVIVTTAEELESFYIVRAILRTKIDADRIAHRDAQTYFAILFDDNNRKPICRVYWNGQKKYLGVFDDNRAEVKYEIKSLNDIFAHAETLEKTALAYLR